MRKTKILSILCAALVAFALLLSACGGQGAPEQSAETGTPPASTAGPESPAEEEATAGEVSVTDMTGRAVVLDKPATRIVALDAASCEIAYALGAGGAVVGRGEFCDWPAEVLEVEVVHSGVDTNVEEVVALAPDIVLMSTMNQDPAQVGQLEEAGIAVYVSEATDIAGTYESITQIGSLLGKSAEAQSLVEDMRTTFDELASQKATGTVYFEVSPLEYGLWAAGSGTFMNEIATIVGLENSFADLEGWVEISEEQVLERNPDYIVTIGMYFGEGPTPDEEIRSRPAWQDLSAVQNNNILNLANNELSRPGPRLAEGARELYDFVTSAGK
jgi:iron complex transport system substrate-binding protein